MEGRGVVEKRMERGEKRWGWQWGVGWGCKRGEVVEVVERGVCGKGCVCVEKGGWQSALKV
jgi:hypothetical protein